MNRRQKIYLAYSELAVIAFLYALVNAGSVIYNYFTGDDSLLSLIGSLVILTGFASYLKDALTFEREMRGRQ